MIAASVLKLSLSSIWLSCLLLTGRNFDEVVAAETGVDVSWPMHHYLDSKSWGGQAYSRFIEGCYKKFGKRSCDSTELARINMNFQQPATQHNYTILGFKKLVAPPLLFSLVKGFWDTNKHNTQRDSYLQL